MERNVREDNIAKTNSPQPEFRLVAEEKDNRLIVHSWLFLHYFAVYLQSLFL